MRQLLEIMVVEVGETSLVELQSLVVERRLEGKVLLLADGGDDSYLVVGWQLEVVVTHVEQHLQLHLAALSALVVRRLRILYPRQHV